MFRIAVVAHIRRADAAQELCDNINAEYMTMDDGTLGCRDNHLKAWEYLADSPEPWGVVLEDDALPTPNFNSQLHAALKVSPTPLVSLYLGKGRPPQWQQRILHATLTADNEHAAWITATRLLYGVAVCIRTELIPSMLDHVKHSTPPIDNAIRDWAHTNDHHIAFTWPSLVDHADGPTLVTHHDGPRDEPRKAWRTGVRDTWNSKQVQIHDRLRTSTHTRYYPETPAFHAASP